MAFHEISFVQEKSTDGDPAAPPPSLPVFYKDDRVALAILKGYSYEYILPEPISELLQSGAFTQQFAYRDKFNQIHSDYDFGRTLTSIHLTFVDDPQAWDKQT